MVLTAGARLRMFAGDKLPVEIAIPGVEGEKADSPLAEYGAAAAGAAWALGLSLDEIAQGIARCAPVTAVAATGRFVECRRVQRRCTVFLPAVQPERRISRMARRRRQFLRDLPRLESV